MAGRCGWRVSERTQMGQAMHRVANRDRPDVERGCRVMFDPSASPEQRLEAVRAFVKRLGQDSAPIVLGPYRSELGFEASYFQPFAAFLAANVKDFASRAVVVTRGGLAPLYASVASRGVDLYALRTVKDVRRENLYDYKRTQLQKQVGVTDWDRRVVEDAARVLDLGPVYHTVHPAWMYWALEPYWMEARGLTYLQKMTAYQPIEKPAKFPGSEQLPSEYVAVKFYTRPTLPYPDVDVEAFVGRVVATLAAQIPVVLLTSSSEYDDHSDLPIEGPNILKLGTDCPADQNLLLQASVMAHAKAFVGTYGGMAQLALRLGVPSVSVWKEFGGTCHAHLSLQSWISKGTKVPFASGSIFESGLWQGVLAVPAPMPAPEPAQVTA